MRKGEDDGVAQLASSVAADGLRSRRGPLEFLPELVKREIDVRRDVPGRGGLVEKLDRGLQMVERADEHSLSFTTHGHIPALHMAVKFALNI